MNFEKAGGGRGEGSARDVGRQEGAKGTTAGGGSAIPPPPVPLNPSDTAFPSPLRARPSQQGHINRSVPPPPPYPPVQPAKTNSDVVAPLAVQTALPEPEYPSSLQGNPPTDRRHAVSRTDALAARSGSRQAQKRSGSAQASAQRDSGPVDGNGAACGGASAGPCGLVAVRNVDVGTRGSCGHRGKRAVRFVSLAGVASVPGTFAGFVGHSDTSVTLPPYPPVQPEPSDAPAKTNADVELPLSAVQVASPDPEYPASLQGKSNAPTPCREQSGCSGCSRRRQTGAKG